MKLLIKKCIKDVKIDSVSSLHRTFTDVCYGGHKTLIELCIESVQSIHNQTCQLCKCSKDPDYMSEGCRFTILFPFFFSPFAPDIKHSHGH